MTAITISRQMGCQGAEVARLTAEICGYSRAWREIINQAAFRSGRPEMALAHLDELGLLDVCPSPEDCLAYTQAINQVVSELAQAGNVVIVGRAGQAILHDWPDVLHVRIIAPLETRARRIAGQHGISLAGAYAQIEASDEYRRAYLERYYHQDWENPALYDLILNTERLTPPRAAEIIAAALARLVGAPA